MSSKAVIYEMELIVWNYIRKQYEQRYGMNVPLALKHLIKQFGNRIIGCNMLTLNEDLDFYNCLSTKLSDIKQQRIKLIYRASEHDFTSKSFHNACNGHGPTLTIIKRKYGNIFGGYTSVSWSSDNKAHKEGLEKLGVTPYHRKSYAPIAKILRAETA